ncbi:carbohydrate-binding protein [Vallitalea guaymasensis]|uniref:carbohydrate-binding protein n=1 Tax=Vallitalea guaymasensis TaxID=1185412 RepID=UPI002729672A|nr:carbohydrate-binding protein [Vallitalea guaymasensis]
MKKKFFRNLLSFIFCFMLILNINGSSILAQTPNVELYSAKLETTYANTGQMTGYYASGYIYVKNLNVNKNVIIHYTYDGYNWYDQSASYYKTLSDGSEVWSFTTSYESYTPAHQYTYNCRFAIKYEVIGDTYWDNNNGNDYFLQCSSTSFNSPYALSKSVVMLDRTGRSYNSIYGSIFLKNLAYDKVVKVRYTTDNWQSYHDVDASYNCNLGNNVEVWLFNTINDGSTIPWSCGGEYAVSYTVNGITYWDNNFGDNYSFSPTQDPNLP